MEEDITCCKHRIQEQHPTGGNVLWKLIIEQLWHASLLVSLNQDLSNSHRTAAVTQTFLHGLTSSHDRDTTNLTLEHDTCVLTANWGGDRVLYHRQVIEAFLDQQPNDSVGVEDEVSPIGVFVSDHSAEYIVSTCTLLLLGGALGPTSIEQ